MAELLDAQAWNQFCAGFRNARQMVIPKPLGDFVSAGTIFAQKGNSYLCLGIRPCPLGYEVLCRSIHEMRDEIARLNALLNTPETEDFAKGVILEAPHQRERWGAAHDEGKSPFDWFWLIGYLAQKAAAAAVAGDLEKAKHHTISTAAALANWHLALSGVDNSMRPGIAEPA